MCKAIGSVFSGMFISTVHNIIQYRTDGGKTKDDLTHATVIVCTIQQNELLQRRDSCCAT